MAQHFVSTKSGRIIEDPPIARFLFSDTRFAPVWTVIRVLIGLSWLEAGLAKFSNPAWMQTGDALKGFWTNAVAVPETGHAAITFDWYRSFLQGMLDAGAYTWFAKLVVFGEILVGVALIVGAFVGIAAVFAALMNWNYIMAGSASSNGLFLVAAIAPRSGLEDRRLLWFRLLPPAPLGHAVDAPQGHSTARKRWHANGSQYHLTELNAATKYKNKRLRLTGAFAFVCLGVV